jgi:hypothetical protein
MNDERERMWKESVATYLKALYRRLPGETEEIAKCPGRHVWNKYRASQKSLCIYITSDRSAWHDRRPSRVVCHTYGAEDTFATTLLHELEERDFRRVEYIAVDSET